MLECSDRRHWSVSRITEDDDVCSASSLSVGTASGFTMSDFRLVVGEGRSRLVTSRLTVVTVSLRQLTVSRSLFDPLDFKSLLAISTNGCQNRVAFGGKFIEERGLQWYEYSMFFPEISHPSLHRLRLRRHAQPLCPGPGRQGLQAIGPDHQAACRGHRGRPSRPARPAQQFHCVLLDEAKLSDQRQ